MSIDTLQSRLDMIQMQVILLQREIELLRRQISQESPPIEHPRTFAELRGLWEGVLVNDEDFQASRLRFPKDLE